MVAVSRPTGESEGEGERGQTGETRADAYATLSLQPSADGNLVEIAYWCHVELTHASDLPEKARRTRIAALNDARAALTAPEAQAAEAEPARTPRVRVPRPRAPFWVMALSLAITAAVPAGALILLRREHVSEQSQLIFVAGAAVLGLLLARAFWIRVPPVLPPVHLSDAQARGQLRLTESAPAPLRVLSHQYLRRRALLAEDFNAVRALDAAAERLRATPPLPEAAPAETDTKTETETETAATAAEPLGRAEAAAAPPSPERTAAPEAEAAPAPDLPAPSPVTPVSPVTRAVPQPPPVAPIAAEVERPPAEDAPAPADAAATEEDEAAADAAATDAPTPGAVAHAPTVTAEPQPPPAVLPAPLPPVARDGVAGTSLLVSRGATPIGAFPLENGRVYTIGSGRGTDITLAAADSGEAAPVATEHARLTVRRGRVLFHHVGEQFESRVNGVATEWAVIEPGDEIAIGDYRIRCEMGGG